MTSSAKLSSEPQSFWQAERPAFLSEMQSVSSWEEVTPFAGSVVAYKINSYCHDSRTGYVLEDESIKFGHIEKEIRDWESGEKGHKMARLLKFEEVASSFPLVNSKLESSMSIRMASGDEINLIGQAVLDNQAKFEYYTQEKANKILEKHLRKLDSINFLFKVVLKK